MSRILFSSRVALEEAVNAKAMKPLLLIVLKAGVFRYGTLSLKQLIRIFKSLNYGVYSMVKSIISHPSDPRASKQETVNRNFVFTNDVYVYLQHLEVANIN